MIVPRCVFALSESTVDIHSTPLVSQNFIPERVGVPILSTHRFQLFDGAGVIRLVCERFGLVRIGIEVKKQRLLTTDVDVLPLPLSYQTNRLEDDDLDNPRTGEIVGGNVPEGMIADPETSDSDGTISIVVEGDFYEVRMPARNFVRQYTIERE